MTFRIRFVIVASLISGTLSAKDTTGRWTGVADTTDEASTRRQEPQSFEINIADGKLTAISIGRNDTRSATVPITRDPRRRRIRSALLPVCAHSKRRASIGSRFAAFRAG